MKTKLLSMVAAGAFLAMAGVASAQGPVTLNETQMDTVTAGQGLLVGAATAFAGISTANANGLFSAATLTQDVALTGIQSVVVNPDVTAIYVFATSTSHSESAGL